MFKDQRHALNGSRACMSEQARKKRQASQSKLTCELLALLEVRIPSRLCRQQEYLEKSVEGLKRKLQASSEAQRADTARFRQVRLQCMSLLSL